MITFPKASFYIDVQPDHGGCRCVLEIGFGKLGLYAMKCSWPDDREEDSIVCKCDETHPAFADRVCAMVETSPDHDTVSRLVAAFAFVCLNADTPAGLAATGGFAGLHFHQMAPAGERPSATVTVHVDRAARICAFKLDPANGDTEGAALAAYRLGVGSAAKGGRH